MQKSRTFETDAGPEEMKHFQDLLDELDVTELRELIAGVGLSFESPLEDIDRDTLEGVLDEVDREIFYREYNWLLEARTYNNGPDLDRFSKLYADTCQNYIDLAVKNRFTREDAAGRICYEKPNKPLHPMLEFAARCASEATEDYRSPEERAWWWEKMQGLVRDFRAGNWHTTRWTLIACFVHRSRAHGDTLAIYMHKTKPRVDIANRELKKVISSTLKKLNTEQTSQRFLQNAAFVLPKKIGDYSLTTIEVKEGLVDQSL